MRKRSKGLQDKALVRMSTVFDVSLLDVEAAAQRIVGHVRRTPCYESPALSRLLRRRTLIKLENLQQAGSFKLRGVLNKLAVTNPADLAAGIVTVSGGNHAIAVAQACQSAGIDALILMPRATFPYNIAATQARGARVELCEDAAQAFALAADYARQGRLDIHAYDDPAIIAGHGTLGLEMLEDAPEITHVFGSIGGGGFMAGVGTALKGRKPAIHIQGVETRGATTMSEALAAGQPVTIRPTSIARTLGAPFATPRTLAAAQAFLDGITVVEDGECLRDLFFLLDHEKILVEPAASCILSAARLLAESLPDDAVIGLILCGSNIAHAQVDAWAAEFRIVV
jgi:threonine dehydratase